MGPLNAVLSAELQRWLQLSVYSQEHLLLWDWENQLSLPWGCCYRSAQGWCPHHPRSLPSPFSEPLVLLYIWNFPPKQSLPPPSPAEHGCWEAARFLAVLEQLIDIRECTSPLSSTPVLPQPSSCSLLLFFPPHAPFVLRIDLEVEK